MASPKSSNPGKTARFYANNPKSRAKHNRDNNKGGKYDKTKAYTRWHSEQRRKLGIMGKGGKDVTKTGTGTESVKTNRGRGGAKRK